jgi:ketosteroid isomerase-like protein
MKESAIIDGKHHEGHVLAVVQMVDGKIVEGVRLMDSELAGHWGAARAGSSV